MKAIVEKNIVAIFWRISSHPLDFGKMPKRKENSPRRQASAAIVDDDCEIIPDDSELHSSSGENF